MMNNILGVVTLSLLLSGCVFSGDVPATIILFLALIVLWIILKPIFWTIEKVDDIRTAPMRKRLEEWRKKEKRKKTKKRKKNK